MSLGSLALFLATANGHLETVTYLLNLGVSPNLQDHAGTSLFDVCLASLPWQTNPERCDALLTALIRAGMNPNISKSATRGTALGIAAGNGPLPLVRSLLKNGADPNGKTQNGITPLMYASVAARSEALSLLLAAGANIDAKLPGTEETALCQTCGTIGTELNEVLAVLASAGANVNAPTSEGWTPLTISIGCKASAIDRAERVATLLAAKADPNLELTHGSPLNIAVMGALERSFIGGLTGDDLVIIKLLVRAGAKRALHPSTLAIIDKIRSDGKEQNVASTLETLGVYGVPGGAKLPDAHYPPNVIPLVARSFQERLFAFQARLIQITVVVAPTGPDMLDVNHDDNYVKAMQEVNKKRAAGIQVPQEEIDRVDSYWKTRIERTKQNISFIEAVQPMGEVESGLAKVLTDYNAHPSASRWRSVAEHFQQFQSCFRRVLQSPEVNRAGVRELFAPLERQMMAMEKCYFSE